MYNKIKFHFPTNDLNISYNLNATSPVATPTSNYKYVCHSAINFLNCFHHKKCVTYAKKNMT